MSIVIQAQNSVDYWDYPCRPGSSEWQQLESIDKMYEVCSVPSEILKNLSTEKLAKLCLDYPAPMIILLYNSPQAGFNNFYNNFNGIRELFNRADVCRFLIDEYARFAIDESLLDWNQTDQGNYSFKLQFFELILAQTNFIDKLSTEEKILLIKAAIDKFDAKQKYDDLFGGNSFVVNVLIMARLLDLDSKLLGVSKESLETGQLVDVDLFSIYQQANKYIYDICL